MNVPARLRSATVALALPVVVLGTGGCLTSQDVIAGAWTLVQVDRKAPAAEGAISLLPDGTFTVRPGCNAGSGTYVIDGNRLVTDALSLTMMACEEAVMTQEQVILAVLEAAPRYEIETGTGRLLLVSDDSTIAFEAR